MEQLEYVFQRNGDLGKVRDLHDAIRVLSAEEFDRLQVHGLALPIPVDPIVSVRRHFPDMVEKLSVEVFDRELAARPGYSVAVLSEAA